MVHKNKKVPKRLRAILMLHLLCREAGANTNPEEGGLA